MNGDRVLIIDPNIIKCFGEPHVLKKLAVLIVAVGTIATAQAQPPGGPQDGPPGGPPQSGPGEPQGGRGHVDREPSRSVWSPSPTAAPEIDPASAMSAFTLLAGGLVMLRGRRSSK